MTLKFVHVLFLPLLLGHGFALPLASLYCLLRMSEQQLPCISVVATLPACNPSRNSASSCAALPNARDLLRSQFPLWEKKKTQYIDKKQDVSALLDHAEEGLFSMVAVLILTTRTDE